jgi:hypothetical protein
MTSIERGICHQNSPVAQTAAASVRTIGVRVGSYDERAGDHVATFDHDLVADAGAGRVEVDAVFFCEGFDGAVFLLVGFVLILDVVVEGEN